MLTVERLRELLDYDPVTGVFCRKNGKVAGGGVAGRYWRVSVENERYYGHRLAWFYVYGVWPKEEVDHIDLNKWNNALANLREATPFQSCGNQSARPTNRLGVKGVRKAERNLKKPYSARIRINNKDLHLGYFASAEEANKAYEKAAIEHFGEFARAK